MTRFLNGVRFVNGTKNKRREKAVAVVAFYKLTCDGIGCGETESIGVLDGRSQVTSEMMKRGWQMNKGGKILCPMCIKKRTPVKPD